MSTVSWTVIHPVNQSVGQLVDQTVG